MKNGLRLPAIVGQLYFVRIIRIFFCNIIQKELDVINKEYFNVLRKQIILSRKRRQLRSEQLLEEVQGVPLPATRGYLDLNFDIPKEMRELDARFEALNAKRNALQNKLRILRPSQFVAAG